MEETLALNDEISGPAEDAASALDSLASAAEGAEAALGSAGGAGIVWEDFAEAANDATSALEETADAAEGVADAAEDVEADGLEDVGDAAEESAGSLESAGEALQGINAGLAIAEKAAKLAGKAIALAIDFGEAIVGAHEFNKATAAALDQLTGGRGQQALEDLAIQAQDLGISTESAVEQFSALREAGASNANATALISLRADLEAVGVSSGDAETAVKKTLEAIKGGKDADAAIHATAEAFGAVGDGANAAARRAFTLEGALDNIQNFKTDLFQTMAAQAGPQLDAIGAKITSVLDSFQESELGVQAGQKLAAALEYVPPIIDAMLETGEAFVEYFSPALDELGAAIDVFKSALGDGTEGMSAAQAVGAVLGAGFRVIASAIAGVIVVGAGLVAAFYAVQDAGNAVVDAISAAPEALSALAGGFVEAGGALVDGFIAGIEAKIGEALAAVTSLGAAAEGALKSALGIASPSKVFAELGAFTGEGFTEGLDASMPTEVNAPELAGGAANDTVPGLAPASAGGGGDVVHITVEIRMPPGATAKEAGDAARAARLELEKYDRRKRAAGAR